MELREPPLPEKAPARPDPVVRGLAVAILVGIAGLAALLLVGRPDSSTNSAEVDRQVAAKLKAAGLLDESAALYRRYLDAGDVPDDVEAGIAYSLGSAFLDRGEPEKALRWLYEAETVAGAAVPEDLASRIVHALERLGRYHAAQAALESGSRMAGDDPDADDGAVHPEGDPIVAVVNGVELRRSDLDQAMDNLPPELAAELTGPEGRARLLEKFVADELLWRKAVKLEYDKDPEVRRRHEALLKQLAVSRLVEIELAAGVEADEADLRNQFEANRARYAFPDEAGGEPKERPFEEVRPLVERDYRMMKLESAYQELIESEMATAEVELHPERLADGG